MLEHLLPAGFFDGLSQPLLLLLTAGGVLVVMKGADWLVEGAAGLAYKLGMAKVVIGATVVSLGTTSPEAAVSVLAAWQGDPGLALGNGVGSIIADTGLIFGAGCLLCALPADRFVLNRQGWIQFGAGLLLAVFCYGYFVLHGDAAELGRWVGAVFLGLLAAYLTLSVRWSRSHPLANPAASKEAAPATGSDTAADGEDAALDAETEAAIREDLAAWQLLGLLLLGLALVVVSGDVLVHSAKELALRWGVPSEVVAATLIAFGTSLPELVVGLTSIRKGHPELLVGNVVGADILNVLFVIGAAAVAAPLQVVPEGSRIFLYLHLPTLLLILVLFRGYIFRALRAGSFARWMGLPLLAIYVAYVVVQYWIAINDYATVPTLPGS